MYENVLYNDGFAIHCNVTECDKSPCMGKDGVECDMFYICIGFVSFFLWLYKPHTRDDHLIVFF